MLQYNYPWPGMFNCSKFPEDNGLCIQPSSQTPSTTTPKPTTTIPSTETPTTTLKPANKRPNKNKNPVKVTETSVKDCYGCDDEYMNLEKIVNGYCQSDLVFRGRIQAIKISKLDLNKAGERLVKNNQLKMNKSMSLYVRVGKRDRKVLKGGKLLASNTFLKESSDEDSSNRDIDVFLLSNYHLNAAGNNGHKMVRSRIRSLSGKSGRARDMASSRRAGFEETFRKRFATNGRHCVCEKLRRNLKRANTKFFIMANVLKSRNLVLGEGVSENSRYDKRYLVDYHKVNGGKVRKAVKGGRHESIVYLTNILPWNRARAFIDYLEDDSIDKTSMCSDVRNTIYEINQANAKLF